VDGAGKSYRCVLESVDRGVAVGRVLESRALAGEIPARITLLVGLPAPGAAEAVVTYGVPLGASVIDLVACERSGRPALSAGRLERLDRLARSALKQSRRSCLTVVRSSASVGAALDLLGPGPRLRADPAGEVPRQVALTGIEGEISIAVGPPGGFDLREAAQLVDAGFRSISLGPSRLATDAAAIALLTHARNALLLSGLKGI
jgi:16S rRNA (uracil1498-N3)-methyltransferase